MSDHAISEGISNPVAGKLGYMMRRVSVMMMADLSARLAGFDLSPVEATVLIVISANPGCTQAEISRLLAIKRANVVALIAALQKKEFLTKTHLDGRSHALNLTASGEAARNDAVEAIEAQERMIANFLDDKERGDLSHALSHLLRLRCDAEPAD